MCGQALAPAMEHGGDGALRPQGLRGAGKRLQGPDRPLEQQRVEHPVVEPQERSEQMGQGEDEGEGGHRQPHGLRGGPPLGPGPALALGAGARAAGVGTELLGPAGLAGLALAPQSRRAAVFTSAQHPLVRGADVGGGAARRPLRAHEVGPRKRGARRGGFAAGRWRWRRPPGQRVRHPFIVPR